MWGEEGMMEFCGLDIGFILQLLAVILGGQFLMLWWILGIPTDGQGRIPKRLMVMGQVVTIAFVVALAEVFFLIWLAGSG